MSSRMQKYRNELKLLCNCSADTRKLLFNKGSREFIKALVDAIWSTLDGRVPLSKKNKDLIRARQAILRKIVAKKTWIKKRRQLLASQSGGNAAVDLMHIIKAYF